MKIGRSQDILDLYDWLPGHGESGVKVKAEGTELQVAVVSDGATGTSERTLRFSSVCSFYMQAFPGPSMLEPGDAETAALLRGVLVEYPESDVAKAWQGHFSGLKDVRHYSVAFLAENLLLVVLAGNVSVNGRPD